MARSDERQAVQELAQSVARDLGEGWTVETTGDADDWMYAVYLVKGELRIHAALDWRKPADRVTFTGRLSHDLHKAASGRYETVLISCARTKTAAQMAKEIARRLLPAWSAEVERAKGIKAGQDDYAARQRAIRARFEDAAPGRVRAPGWQSEDDTSFYIGNAHIRPSADGFRVEWINLPADAAEEFAQLIAKFHTK